MKYKKVLKTENVERYKESSNDSVIATCAIVGTVLTLSFSSQISEQFSLPKNDKHNTWIKMSDSEIKQNEETAVFHPICDVSRFGLLLAINNIEKLKFNWDGDGAEAPNKDAMENARHLIMKLSPQDISHLDVNDIYPSTYGSIIMDFEMERGVVSVELGDKTLGFYTDFSEGDNYAAEGISTEFEYVPEILQKYLS